MKIDKIIFSCSVEYSGFWNTQARVYKSMGIEPTCLLFGKKSDTQMTEEHGRVIECVPMPDVPWNVHMAWSKFHYPLTEPEAVWMIGDMDLIPLQRHHFTTLIAGAPNDAMLHLNAAGISAPRLGMLDGFRQAGCQRRAKDKGQQGGADLPAHYFAAKGKFYEIFTLGRSVEEAVRHIVQSDRYGLGPMGDKTKDPYWYYWCAEETYSSELLQIAMEQNKVNFIPVFYNNTNDNQRIDRTGWNGDRKDYTYTPERLRRKQFVDIHCARPFVDQEPAMTRIVNESGVCQA